MAHHNSNVGFFSMIGGSLLAAALLVALLVGGEIAGPKVRLNSSPFTTARWAISESGIRYLRLQLGDMRKLAKNAPAANPESPRGIGYFGLP